MNFPTDQKSSPHGIQTGEGFSVEIRFNSQIVDQLVDCASHFNVTLYHVCLTIYYIFLFKLSGGQRDLVVGIVQSNRYRAELQHMIGMFVNTLPMRVHVDPQDTFEQLLHRVSDMMFETQPYSNLPYQIIIEQLMRGELRQQNLIQTMFTLDERPTTHIRLDHASVIEPWSMPCLNDDTMQIGAPTNAVAMFDVTLSMEYIVARRSLRAELIASSDLFDSTTVITMARGFQIAVEQLLLPLSTGVTTTERFICDLSLFLPEENIQFESMPVINSVGISILARASFAQMSIWLDEQTSSDSQVAIHNTPFFHQITEGTLSIGRLHRALGFVVLKHSSLRTSLFFDSIAGCLMQRIVQSDDDNTKLYIFIKSTLNNDMDMRTIIFDERHNPSLFDVSNGRVFRVHVVVHHNGDPDLLQAGDFLIINFHQSAFDTLSLDIFHRDLCIAYECETALSYCNNELRYIDCKLKILCFYVFLPLFVKCGMYRCCC